MTHTTLSQTSRSFEDFMPRSVLESNTGEQLKNIILNHDATNIEKAETLKAKSFKKLLSKDFRAYIFGLTRKDVEELIHAIESKIIEQEALAMLYEKHPERIADVEDIISRIDEYIRNLEVAKHYLQDVGRARIFAKVDERKATLHETLDEAKERVTSYKSKDPLYDAHYLYDNRSQFEKDLVTIENNEHLDHIVKRAIARALSLIGENNNLSDDKKDNKEKITEEESTTTSDTTYIIGSNNPIIDDAQQKKPIVRIIPDNIHESLTNLPLDINKITKHEFFRNTPVTYKSTVFRKHDVIKDVLTMLTHLGCEWNENNIRLDTHSDTFLISIPEKNISILAANNYGIGTVVFPTANIPTDDLCNLRRDILRRNYMGRIFTMAHSEKDVFYKAFLDKLQGHLSSGNTLPKDDITKENITKRLDNVLNPFSLLSNDNKEDIENYVTQHLSYRKLLMTLKHEYTSLTEVAQAVFYYLTLKGDTKDIHLDIADMLQHGGYNKKDILGEIKKLGFGKHHITDCKNMFEERVDEPVVPNHVIISDELTDIAVLFGKEDIIEIPEDEDNENREANSPEQFHPYFPHLHIPTTGKADNIISAQDI